MHARVLSALATRSSALALLLAACSSGPDLPRGLPRPGDDRMQGDWYKGPAVQAGETGPARFVGPLKRAFRTKRAMDVVTSADRFYRAPASPGYDLVLDELAEVLRGAGFGADERLLLDVVERPAESPAWTPRSGSVTLLVPGRPPEVLHAFERSEDAHRTMLPVNAPSASVEGEVALDLEDARAGRVLVTNVALPRVLSRAERHGAAAVLSASLGPYNVDPSGKERHLDAIQYRDVRAGTTMPVAQISPRSFERIRNAAEAAAERGQTVRIALAADVEIEDRPLRTLIATVVGRSRPDEAVAISSHVQEPGACDNASGLAGLVESARVYADLLGSGELPWPQRSVTFVWGDEFVQTHAWLETTKRRPIVGLSSDMTGQSKDTGAIALVERMPDPGALVPLPPDEHTSWGAGEVEAESLRPNGLAIVARCAMMDVAATERDGWPAADHPWEGGSDHDVFIERGIPAVLFWHFPDFTYHTSLDRLEFVDPDEVRRTAVALLATALAVADPEPADLERYLASLRMEEEVRVDAALAASDATTAERWQTWCRGARQWLRNLCLGIDELLPPAEGQ